MRALLAILAAGLALASCQAAPVAPLAPPAGAPTYQWRVEDERLGELLVSAWREGEWFRVAVRGRWPARDARTGASLPAASTVRVYRAFAERSADGEWRVLNAISIETIRGRWRPGEDFELATRLWAQTLEHPEEGGFGHFCMGPRAWCYPVDLLRTSDPAAPWSETPIERPSIPPPGVGNRVALLPVLDESAVGREERS